MILAGVSMQPLSQFFQDPKIRRNLMIISLWVALFGCLWVIHEVLLPFIVAGFLGYILNPLVTRANQNGPKRPAVVLQKNPGATRTGLAPPTFQFLGTQP